MYAEISVIPSTVPTPGYSVLGHMRQPKSESVFLSYGFVRLTENAHSTTGSCVHGVGTLTDGV